MGGEVPWDRRRRAAATLQWQAGAAGEAQARCGLGRLRHRTGMARRRERVGMEGAKWGKEWRQALMAGDTRARRGEPEEPCATALSFSPSPSLPLPLPLPPPLFLPPSPSLSLPAYLSLPLSLTPSLPLPLGTPAVATLSMPRWRRPPSRPGAALRCRSARPRRCTPVAILLPRPAQQRRRPADAAGHARRILRPPIPIGGGSAGGRGPLDPPAPERARRRQPSPLRR